MRIAVIGGGYWGSKHVRVLHDLVEVDQVSLVDPRAERRSELSRTFPALATFEHLEEALPHVDAVVVATPPETHCDLALQAIEAGKHVLVEKPLALSGADGRLMIEAARARDLVLMTGHTFLYEATVAKLKELIDTGELGSIYYLDSARLNLGLYQTNLNVIWDLAPHDVSIMNHLLDATPDVVQAWGSSHAHRYHEDVGYLRLEYRERNVTAQIHVSWLDPCKVRRVTVVGSKKMAVYNDVSTSERLRIYDKGVDFPHDDPLHVTPTSYRYGSITSPYVAGEEPLRREDHHFVESVTYGLRPTTDGPAGLAVVEVLEAAERSLRSGQPEKVGEIDLTRPVLAR